MATKRVAVYFMHEDEERECHRALRDASWSAGHGVGSMDEEDIERLEESGVVVEVIEEPPPPREASRGADEGFDRAEAADAAPAPRRRRRPRFLGLSGPPREAVLHPEKDNVFAIAIDGPFLMPAWREELSGLGVELRERLPDGRYTAYLSLDQVGRVRELDFVREVRLFGPDDCASATFSEAAAEPEGGTRTLRRGAVETADVLPLDETEPEAPLPFDVLLHRPEEMADVRRWMDEHGVTVLGAGRRKLRVELEADSPLVREIEALPEVRQVAEYVEPELANQVARRLLGLDHGPGGNPASGAVMSWTGEGEIVAVADSGLDADHPDFAGRVAGLVARARTGDPSDLHGHGTHVAGSACGDGAASNGEQKGTAPGAKLFFQSIMDAHERLAGLPVELGELFDEAYRAGARIHNNSWSAHTRSFYTFNALEVDEYIEAHPDLLVTIAAGNEGSAAEPFNVEPGFVEWLSIGSPATAKNALTVGASRSARTDGGLAARSYRQFAPRKFPDPPIADATVSGDPECLAAFSARGPCDPRRIKPDVVAPGTDVLSTRASTAPASTFWGLLPGNDRYAYLGGTSMATPLVSGCAALVREYLRKARGHEPSAALVKAILINGTRRLGGADALADHAGLPNFHQGFGAVYMPWAIPNPEVPWLALHFADTWKEGGRRFEVNGRGRVRLGFEIRGGDFLRLCLAWTDPAAGSSLQNILGLMLEHPGLAQPKRLGNQDRPSPVGKLDRDNNVQIIRIENPPPGNYLVQVFAANLFKNQDWALAVTGDLAGGLVEV